MTDSQTTKDILVYQMLDELGEVDTYCVDDASENICIGGHTKDGKYHQFDSYEAYHLSGWIADRGLPFKMTCHKITISIPETNWEEIQCPKNLCK